ncbi:MAG: phytanoyl-CoA dioxygenase family protein [Cyanobacteria bacterium J06648_16]
MLSACLGPDALLWIGQVVNRKAGGRGQPWHIDQINWEVSGVHASIAITDMNLSNGCLQVIPKTHHYQLSQSDLEAHAKAANADLWDGQAMVKLADQLHPENAPHQLVSLEVKAGQCFFTRGGLWHGVTKSIASQPRIALVTRYMRPDIAGQGTDGRPLSCIQVLGVDEYHKNRLSQPPRSWFRNNLLLNYRLNKLLSKASSSLS